MLESIIARPNRQIIPRMRNRWRRPDEFHQRLRLILQDELANEQEEEEHSGLTDTEAEQEQEEGEGEEDVEDD